MKFLFYWLSFLLIASACSQAPVQSSIAAVVTPPADLAPTQQATPTEDSILNQIKISFSAGPHALSYTCNNCHSTTAGMPEKISWLDETSGQFEPVASSTELCTKCHNTPHLAKLVTGDRQIAHSGFECTSCHDAHTTRASCTQSTCHSDIQSILATFTEMAAAHASGASDPSSCGGAECHDRIEDAPGPANYHGSVHLNVPCYICHDSSGMTVTRLDNQTWITIAESGNAYNVQQEQISHIINRDVKCDKCHYKNNSWNLMEIQSTSNSWSEND